MSAAYLDGKELSKKLKAEMKAKVDYLVNKYSRAPHLAVIIVGDDPASQSYVRGKEKACAEVGIKTTTIKLPEFSTENLLLEQIDRFNNDFLIDGILVQLPLPKHINQEKIINAILPTKDVDGFHPENVAALYTGSNKLHFEPCTPLGVIKLLDEAKIILEGKNICIVGRSNLVGKPLAQMLLNRNATVTICHSKTQDLSKHINKADILIVATGQPNTVTADMLTNNLEAIVDVGVNRVDGHLVGDVSSACKDNCLWITPVPGGVGPMTITCLLENTIKAYCGELHN